MLRLSGILVWINIKVVESVQRRITKRLCRLQRLSYSERLNALGMLGISTLRARRNYLDLVELYKIIRGLSVCGQMPTPARSVYITRGHLYRLKQEKSKLN